MGNAKLSWNLDKMQDILLDFFDHVNSLHKGTK